MPQTGQTLAVLIVGAVLGPLRGATAVVIYVALGALGLPVFADGDAGWDRLTGPTGGYLVGFVAGAVIAGRGALRIASWPRLVLVMLAAHAAILALGFARLAVTLGAADAYARGVEPFFVGALVKSALAALVAWAWRRHTEASSSPTGASQTRG